MQSSCYKQLNWDTNLSWASERVQQVQALAAKFDHLNSIPGIHMGERENQFMHAVLWLSHGYFGTRTHMHARMPKAHTK